MTQDILTLAPAFLLALLLSLALVPMVRAVAVRLGYLAPVREGEAASRPKALFGGVAIALALFACAIVLGLAEVDFLYMMG